MKYQNNFGKIKKLMLQALDEAVTETGEEMLSEVRANAPRKTGELAESYEMQKTGFASVEIGSPLERAIIAELGGVHHPAKPHLAPTQEKAPEKVAQKFKDKIRSIAD